MRILKSIIFLSLISIFLTATQKVKAEISVIVNQNNNSTISSDDIKRIFLGKLKTFPGGTSAVPINLKASNPSRDVFDTSVLHKSSSQIKAYWSKLVFSGKGNPPLEVATDKEAVESVMKDPTAIGYVDSANVAAGVKVIATF